jgi:phosphopantothenoylcysteine decarboxylase/phosphopantothenate--cysteine ligase
MFEGKTVVICVTGGIAAYKSCDLASKLVQAGADVHVMMTRNAEEFVRPLTFRALTGNPVISSLFDEIREFQIGHVSLSDKTDCFVVAPATLNILGKIAQGIADDAVTTIISAGKCPVLLAPAMHTSMWENPITQANVRKLKELGYRFVGPDRGWLASGGSGIGRMAAPEEIMYHVETIILGRAADLSGYKVVITSGPTREPIDPVRFLSNPSTGRMGHALARAAAARGGRTVLVSGPTALAAPAGVEYVEVETAREMFDAVMAAATDADLYVGAAAVADYAPRNASAMKVKKADASMARLELEKTPDIIASLAARRRESGDHSPVLVGFAAETDDVVEHARAKLVDKGLELIVANDVTQADAGFAVDTNAVTLVPGDGEHTTLPPMPKREVADRVLDEALALLKGTRSAV